MRNIYRIAMSALAAAALVLVPASMDAQSRGGGHSGSSSHSSGASSGRSSSSSSSSSRHSGSSGRSHSAKSHSGNSGSRSYNVGGQSRQRSNSSMSSSRSGESRQSGSVRSGEGRRSVDAGRSSGSGHSVNGGQSSQNGHSSYGNRQAGGNQHSGGNAMNGGAYGSHLAGGSRSGYYDRYSGRTPVRATPVNIHDNRNRIPPHRREMVSWHEPHHFYGRGPRCYGRRVGFLPAYEFMHCWGCDYYLYDGIYYRLLDGIYYVARPPFGVLFDCGLYELGLHACRFAYYNTVYNLYDTVDANYATIQQQNRTIAENNALIASQQQAIAAGNAAGNNALASESYALAGKLGLVQSYAANGTQYFYDDGVFFITGADNKYEVIVPPAGALVTSLPDDYETVTIDGTEYYKVDETLYRMTVKDGTAYFEVLGQIPAESASRFKSN